MYHAYETRSVQMGLLINLRNQWSKASSSSYVLFVIIVFWIHAAEMDDVVDTESGFATDLYLAMKRVPQQKKFSSGTYNWFIDDQVPIRYLKWSKFFECRSDFAGWVFPRCYHMLSGRTGGKYFWFPYVYNQAQRISKVVDTVHHTTLDSGLIATVYFKTHANN